MKRLLNYSLLISNWSSEMTLSAMCSLEILLKVLLMLLRVCVIGAEPWVTTIRPLKLLSPSLSSFKLRLVNSRLLRTNLKLPNRSLRKLLPRKLLSMLNTLKSKKLRTECKLRPTNSKERWTKQPSLLTLSLITRSDGLRTLLNLLKLRFSFVEMSLKLVPLSLTVDLSMLSLELSCSSRISATIST